MDSLCIHVRSAWQRIRRADGDSLGAWMNSKTWMVMSLRPLWSGAEKCLPTEVSDLDGLSILKKWHLKRSFTSFLVCPTYCLRHFLQLMQYIRLLLLHVTLCLVANLLPVTLLVICPVLSSLVQYLQTCFAMHFLLACLAFSVRESLGSLGILAWTRMSLRFWLRLWPKVTFC